VIRARGRARSLATAVVLGASLAVAASSGEDRVAQGRALFKDEGCPQCHGFGGKGDGYLLGMLKEPVKMRDWTDPETMRAFDDAYLFEITKRGGEALGKSKVMLKYSHELTDEQIRDVVAFIRSLAAPAPPS
jgi:mono/diheme cytochrome c family protein